MKIASLLPPAAAVAVLAAAIFAATTGVQATQASPQAGQSAPTAPEGPPPQGPPPEGRAMRNFPAPTNLQVLPKDLTGHQVRDIMETWAGSLGVHCDFCHVADPNNLGPNGRPRMNFPDDSKPNKQIARIMYTMTQQMNKDYISKAMDLDKDNMGTPVTCGTCHRGHQMPEDFVIPREQRPGGPGGGSGAPQPGESTPPTAPPTN